MRYWKSYWERRNNYRTYNLIEQILELSKGKTVLYERMLKLEREKWPFWNSCCRKRNKIPASLFWRTCLFKSLQLGQMKGIFAGTRHNSGIRYLFKNSSTFEVKK